MSSNASGSAAFLKDGLHAVAIDDDVAVSSEMPISACRTLRWICAPRLKA